MKFRLFVLGSAVLAMFGCAGKKETTVLTPDGKVTVSGEGKGGTTTIDSPEGKLEIKGDEKTGSITATNEKGETVTVGAGQEADLSKLGVDIYPGAKPVGGQTGIGKVEGPQGTMATAVLTTSDSVEQVLAFYKEKLKDAKAFSGPEAGMVNGKSANGADVTASAARPAGKSETTLTLSVTTKK